MIVRRWLATAVLLAYMSPRLRARPYRMYRAIQSLGRVHRSPFGFWVITGHAEVEAALKNRAFGNDQKKADKSLLKVGRLNRLVSRRQPQQRVGPYLEMFDQLVVFVDPPDHTRLRRLISKAAGNSRANALETLTTKVVGELLDSAELRGSMELVNDFAYRVPARLMCELLGVPVEDVPFVVGHAPALAAGLNPSSMRTEEMMAEADLATVELQSYIRGLISQRRGDTSQDDLLTSLIAAEEEGDRLSETELVTTVLGVLFAGIETTSMAISSGTLTLLQNPDQRDLFMAQPDLGRRAVDELIRYESPFQILERTTVDDVTVDGQKIPKGSIVILCLAAANRDPRAFAQPNRVDIRRDPNPHVAFGGGPHFCIGSHMARMEAATAMAMLFQRFPSLRLVGDDPDWRNSFTVRGLRELHVTW